MKFFTIIQNFTGVYGQQPFMQALHKQHNTCWIDCSKISGTDCYCDDDAQAELRKKMDEAQEKNSVENSGSLLPEIHFFDNGNYHYMSKLWTDQVQEPFDLVVFDHHPDMQPPRFEGILSCGGWVKEVLDKNKFVRNVLLIGVADHLVTEIQNDPTAEFEKYKGRVQFITESEIGSTCWHDKFPNIFKEKFVAQNIYISIDKDALCNQEAVTNWDQGSLTFEQLRQMLCNIFDSRRILAVDICGEHACNQDYADGIDEGKADVINNKLNEKIFKLLQETCCNE